MPKWAYEATTRRVVRRAECLCTLGHAIGPALLARSAALCLRVAPLRNRLRLGWQLHPLRWCEDPSFCLGTHRGALCCAWRADRGVAPTFDAGTRHVELVCTIAGVSHLRCPSAARVEGFSGPPSPSFQLRAPRLLRELCLASSTVAALCPP